MKYPLSTAIFVLFDVLYLGFRVHWANKADRRPVREQRTFLLDKINIGLVGVFTLIVPLLALFTSWFERFDYSPVPVVTLASIPVLALGLVTFWLAHRDLAENWSVTLELKEGHQLITHGIFSRIRHPMYLSIWLCAIGQALCVPNWVGGFGGLVAWSILYFVRIDREESMMLEKFGDSYRAYMARTKRLVPYLV